MAGRVTAIQAQKRNPRRASVFIEGQFAFGLEMIEAARLSKGQYLSDDDIVALVAADEEERAYGRALGFLSYRPRSQAEVSRRLQQKGFSEPAIGSVLHRLSRAGLLDDEAFARYWISNREQFNPRGRYALSYELRQKGVSVQIIDALLHDVDDQENAYRVAVKRLAKWERLEPAELRRKLSAHLRRRGFGYSVIAEAWARIQAERATDGADLEEGENTTTWD